MTAVEAIIRAQAAGLVLTAVPDGLNVRGRKAIRAKFAPVLLPLADEVLALLAQPPPCVPGPQPCLACCYVHSTFKPRSPCEGCGRTDWVIAEATDSGSLCHPCCLGDGVVFTAAQGAMP